MNLCFFSSFRIGLIIFGWYRVFYSLNLGRVLKYSTNKISFYDRDYKHDDVINLMFVDDVIHIIFLKE